ncbi:hypothetical protein, partial [Acetobacter fabarum]|uniref:hypothetical protein n=1 Tax=Acetobacter fabarum TaxID=483199 RepID=UPI0039E9C058
GHPDGHRRAGTVRRSVREHETPDKNGRAIRQARFFMSGAGDRSSEIIKITSGQKCLSRMMQPRELRHLLGVWHEQGCIA